MSAVKQTKETYLKVVNEVIDGVREAFADEGCDEQVLHELKQMWEGRLMQSKAMEDIPKPSVEIPTEHAHQASSLQQAQALRVAPPAHQHHQQQIPQAPVPQVTRQPVAPVLNLQGQLVALAPHGTGAVQPGRLTIAGAEQFGQSLTHFLVPGQNQLLIQPTGRIVQQPGQQLQFNGQTFTLAPATQQQIAMRPVDPKSVAGSLGGVVQVDGSADTVPVCVRQSIADTEITDGHRV